MFHIHRIYDYSAKFKMATKMAAGNHSFSNYHILVAMVVRTMVYLSRLCYIGGMEFISSRKIIFMGQQYTIFKMAANIAALNLHFSHISVNRLYMNINLVHKMGYSMLRDIRWQDTIQWPIHNEIKMAAKMAARNFTLSACSQMISCIFM